MEIEAIIYIVLGILALVFLLQRKRFDKKPEYDSYADEKNAWSILTSFSEFKVLSKYAGELRFGPTFIHLKTEPKNTFGKQFFGDWFYRTENGVYLQKWNSDPIKSGIHTRADNDLIYYDRLKNRIEIIETGIKSFLWEMEKDNDNGLTLISKDGKTENRIKITNAN
jgi:hypothetical protein